MPEGPEVARYADFLDKRLKAKSISCIDIISGRYKKHGPFPGYENIPTNIPVERVSCYGKLLYFLFDDENHSNLMSTLGMSGAWQNHATKHTRVIIRVSDGGCVYYNDIRNFGTLKYNKSYQALDDKVDSLGLDFLKTSYRINELENYMSLRWDKTISEFLMDQRMCAGIGNYLKAEILYASKISPHRKVKDISSDERVVLLENLTKISRTSYHFGGATISTYRDKDGNEGLYNRRFAVYNQKTDPLGNNVIKEKTKDKRTTHWVPNIQK